MYDVYVDIMFYVFFSQGCMLVLGRLFGRVDLIKPISNIRLSVRTYLRPSVHKRFLRFK